MNKSKKRFKVVLKSDTDSYLVNMSTKKMKETFTQSQLDKLPNRIKRWIEENCDVVEVQGRKEKENG